MKKKILINEAWDQVFNQQVDNFANHAFPLFLFTKRLYEEVAEVGCKDLLFMSREGQFLKKLFDRYCEIQAAHGKVLNVKTHYFYGSRNSIMKASVESLDQEKFVSLFKFFNICMSPKNFMYSIGFSDDQIQAVRETFGRKTNSIVLNFKHSALFKKLKQNQTFVHIYENNRQEQACALDAYFKSLQIDYQKDGLFFVDIGYHGTMQDLIFKFFHGKVKVTGFYLKSRAEQSINNRKIGLLGDKNNRKLFGAKITQYDCYNYEQILRADHGRCIGYSVDSANLGQPMIDPNPADPYVYTQLVKKLQDQILEKFTTIAEKAWQQPQDIEAMCIIYNYYLVKNKTKADFKWILDMQDSHKDDFGFVGYPGKMFSKGIKKFVFKIKDRCFLVRNSGYVKKLTQSYLQK